MFWKAVREQINIFLYDRKKQVFWLLSFITPIVILAGVLILLYEYGFNPELKTSVWFNRIFNIIVNVLFIRFLVRYVFSRQPIGFIRANAFESVVYFLLLLDFVFYLFFSQPLWFSVFNGLTHNGYIKLIRYFFIIILLIEIGRGTYVFNVVKLNPAALLALSFVILIVTGALLLRMPEMTIGGTITWVDAFFTSTSACCVTGLTVQDTGTFFTFKGQIVIMILFLIGGLNMLTIATFIGSLYHQTGSLHVAGVIKGFLDTDQTANLQSILRNVILYAFVIQLIGAVVIFLSWGNSTSFVDFADRMFYSVFHSISAFNNAGFSLFTDGLFNENVRFQYLIHIEIAFLIVVGGLGFLVLQDIFAIENRRNRKKHPWKRYQINTHLVLLITVILIIGGSLLFFVFEYNNALKEHSFAGKIVTAFFQSVTTRTAGFNTVDTALLTRSSVLLFLVLMFIGASPGSTGGGIKTTTIAVAFKAAWANIRGREHVEFFKRNISWNYVNKTYAVLFSAFAFIILFSFILVLAEPNFSLKELFFELVSAFGTVGLSMGITSELSVTGKLIIITSMFVGRIGFLTLGLALTRKVMYTKYRYPNGKLMIG